MKHIDNLIIKAQETARRREGHLYAAFIDYDGSKQLWHARCAIWTGIIKGQSRNITGEHKTLRGAENFVKRTAERYPNTTSNVPVIIDEIGSPLCPVLV